MYFSFPLSQGQGPPYYLGTSTSMRRHDRVAMKMYYMIDYIYSKPCEHLDNYI